MTSRWFNFSRSSAIAAFAAAALAGTVATGVASAATTQHGATAHAAATAHRYIATRNAVARRANPTNPLAGREWGIYQDPRDSTYQAYEHSSGATRTLIGKVVLRPRVRWFGSFNKYSSLYKSVRRYIEYSQNGNPNAVVQMAVFRMVPWEAGACNSVPGAAGQKSYRKWIDRFATAVGRTHAAIILQPDLPLALCSPHHSMVPLNLVSYAAKRFSRLPNATTYIDAGAADWETVGHASWLLRSAGVGYTRGFALNASHSDSTSHQLVFGNKVRRALAAKGYRNMHFVINTAANGRPFTHTFYRKHYRAKYGNSAPACQTASQRRCVTLGIPPTADVANPQWGLSSSARSIAASYCDGYLWIGRSWINHNVFDRARTLDIARTTPYS
jgi:endoglucanase